MAQAKTMNAGETPAADSAERTRIAAARESYSGRLLTDTQFAEAIALTRIVERGIRTAGSFKDKLTDYAHAFARSERMDGARAETILRDLYKARTGRTMNALREDLAARADALTRDDLGKALAQAELVGPMIETGDKITFARAFAARAGQLGKELGITASAAKAMMRDAYEEKTGTDLVQHGKALEEQFYRPQIEAEQKQRRDGGENADGQEGGGPETGDSPARSAKAESGTAKYRPRKRSR